MIRLRREDSSALTKLRMRVYARAYETRVYQNIILCR
jgi:hypothetical protein